MRQGLLANQCSAMTKSLLVAATLIASTLSALATPAGPMSRIDGPNSLVVEAQSRICRACRNSCVREYKWACGYSERCRVGFTRCMRQCWEDVCR